MNEDKNEVFCKDCKYFKHWKIGKVAMEAIFDIETDDQCAHPENIAYKPQYDKKEKVYLKTPERLNSSNNCYRYVRKVSLLRVLLQLLFKK